MGSLQSFVGFLLGFAVAWFVIRFIAIKWRDSGKNKERSFDSCSPMPQDRGRQDDGIGVQDDKKEISDDDTKEEQDNKKEGQDEKVRDQDGIGGNVIEQQAEVKAENLQKITEALKNQDQITNNEVEHMLGVSDATATRYLDELEKQGIVEQIGATGAGVIYRRK
ncbi:DeoR family transcriptional regulator [Patescibacteria group bacterium]|nr:DeoR family transcriptional regulator [Patescibacteria group bacterium]